MKKYYSVFSVNSVVKGVFQWTHLCLCMVISVYLWLFERVNHAQIRYRQLVNAQDQAGDSRIYPPDFGQPVSDQVGEMFLIAAHDVNIQVEFTGDMG